jgi:hypothetical protein
MTSAPQISQLSPLFAALLVALLAGLAPDESRAAAIFFSDRATWQAAVVGVPFAENFESFPGDTSFASSPVALSGMTISREGPEPGITNFIDVPPLTFSPGSGTSQAELFTNFEEGVSIGTLVRISFDSANVALGFDAWAASDFEDAILEIFDGPTLLGSQVLPGGNGAFLGYILTGGDAATSVRFRSATLIVGTTGEGFAIDNLAGAAVVPEPGTIALTLLGLIGVAVRRRRNG